MSVRPSVRCLSVSLSVCQTIRIGHLGSHWSDFYEIFYLSIFLNSVEKLRFSLKSDKNDVLYMKTNMYIYDHISLISS